MIAKNGSRDLATDISTAKLIDAQMTVALIRDNPDPRAAAR
jgi:hypothetical protein